MIPAGFMYKKVEKDEDLPVSNIYGLGGCITTDFTDYINYWKHNKHWLFDSPLTMEEIAKSEGIMLEEMTLFYYEIYEFEYFENSQKWELFSPLATFPTNVQIPTSRHLEGFDVTCFSGNTNPDCSPLSCNGLANTIPVNEHCLFNTFDEARLALENGLFNNSEPGPFRISAVYSLPNPSIKRDALKRAPYVIR